ncbi:hypothetical protein, unlikely [Trypanosoma brucei brucei TREU927]|uniref:Uncharacterized protein n=1 Tax=Trypanosoma brucei brucei (strain 927/4 GUTat10.1) TaxID=185431 RepID=Q38AN7_TRYB2|nr:hypothetical protein, unlikely [Trypanosoma brucei brucei TREU927]EAN78133.1 hypothetical protein, unlikely [Trypanosoma brucei brucei TREU927]
MRFVAAPSQYFFYGCGVAIDLTAVFLPSLFLLSQRYLRCPALCAFYARHSRGWLRFFLEYFPLFFCVPLATLLFFKRNFPFLLGLFVCYSFVTECWATSFPSFSTCVARYVIGSVVLQHLRHIP